MLKALGPLEHLCISFFTVAAPGSTEDEDREPCSALPEGIPSVLPLGLVV